MRRSSLVLALALLAGCNSDPSAEVTESLLLADDNRPELDMVLGHFRIAERRGMLPGAVALVGGMQPHGTATYEWTDAAGIPIGYDPLRFADVEFALAELQRLQDREPGIALRRTNFERDVETVLAKRLIQNVTLAYSAKWERPWAQTITPEIFQEWILPHRVGTEPLTAWREECLAQWADLARRMEDPTDLAEAARLVLVDLPRWIRHDARFELTEDQQSFASMRRRGVGSHADIANLAAYALRANAVPCAIDTTPARTDAALPRRWVVPLDANGEGVAPQDGPLAKVYRETYAGRPGSLAARLPLGTALPLALAAPNRLDVTGLYTTVADLELRVDPGAGDRALFLCIESEGAWRAVDGAPLDADGTARFTHLGCGMRYRPAWFRDGRIVPAGPPFRLAEDGTRTEEPREGPSD